jgi:type IV pilus assembly protein PilO
MTNPQAPAGEEPALAGSRLSPRQLLLLPLALGGVVALALLGGWVIPQLQKLNEANKRQAQKQATAAGIPLLRQQLDQTITATERAELQQARLLALIAGSGDLATFLTQVDRQAQRHGVQLDVLQPAKPKGVPGEPAPPAPAASAAPAEPPDPLAGAGLQATQMQLKAVGTYPNLLGFIRAMERLSLLVRQSGFTLQQVGPTAGQAPAAAEAPADPAAADSPANSPASPPPPAAAPAPAPTAMTFTLTLYSSSKTGSSQP